MAGSPAFARVYKRPGRHLEVGGGLHAAELEGQRGDAGGGAVAQELVEHEVQQGGAPVGALDVRQLQQRVQLEAWPWHKIRLISSRFCSVSTL